MVIEPILTLQGMYQFDNTILSNYVIPDKLDRDILNGTILDYCGNNAVRYTDPETLHSMINLFFNKNAKVYQDLCDTMFYDYDPLVNYDLEITETRHHEGNDNENRSVNGEASGNTTDETRVSAYNSSSYSPSEQVTSHGESKNSGTETTRTDTEHDETISRREKGDNSARSTQYMIQEQRKVVDFNLYDRIRSDFENEITIAVYTRRVPIWR